MSLSLIYSYNPCHLRTSLQFTVMEKQEKIPFQTTGQPNMITISKQPMCKV